MSVKKQQLCHFSDISEGKCKSFSVEKQNTSVDIFLLKRNGEIFAYKNHCPHTGVNLNWQSDEFMDFENFYIQCSIHGARFEVETGLCVWGPCANQFLIKIEVHICNDIIYY